MTKSIIAIATAILAATTLLSPAAEAGFRVGFGFGGGVPPYLTDYNKQAASEHKRSKKRAYRAARRHDAAPAKVTKKKASSVAKVETKVEEKKVETVEKVAQSENSSISVAQATPEPKTVAETVETVAASQPARSIDCKKFFATVGMTLTVPCE
jgi:hypothetical protein